jgi:hypothetical protein
MKNIKGIAVATDGGLKRMAITYDVIDEETGKVTSSNVKANRVVTDDEVLGEIAKIEQFARSIIDAE